MREVVNAPEVGNLFDGDDPRALAAALLGALDLASDPATAAACRARAEEFSADRCANRYLELYAALT
jgi:glycosyltransferase involved in cell wall biosynthesis